MAPDISRLFSGMVQEDTSHQAISSYFIGPHAENLQYFRNNISTILDELELARKNYFPEDGPFITGKIQNSTIFQSKTRNVAKAIQKAANLLGKHSLPFWSPRYEAHMCMDLSMPALLGYFMTTIYNPNNVAIEASPMTTVAEIQAGEQLCQLFGYNIDDKRTDVPLGWGHITCGGTVANLESIWVARNLKFYPLSLRLAMKKDQRLSFIEESKFEVETCAGEVKAFAELSTWELLNLKSNTILDIPDRLYEEYGISADFLSTVLNDFNIQTTGKDVLEREFNMESPCQYMLATTRHYSWPKGGAIAGIGSGNVIGIDVDDGARVDLAELEKALQKALENKQAVFAVVAIIGSTEEGAVDPLSSILQLRKKYQALGLSFLVHGDAAWGGYFCSMLPKDYKPGDVASIPNGVGGDDGFVPDFALRAQTQEDLFALRYADSITVDPHKAGYIPYPAGGLCYRDGRMRYLVTWTSPYLSRGAVTSIGIYGVEGSKPGAAAMSTWLSNKAIGLDDKGYGPLLNEVTYTCTRLSAEWAAMSTPDMDFTVVPFNMLPSETALNATPQSIEAEKQRIRNEILGKTNSEIAATDASRPTGEGTFSLLRALGSDLNINAFALNFRYPDGKLNDDVEEANYLMGRVVETLSVDSPGDDPTKLPLFLTSTMFEPHLYGKCAETFKKRLGLKSNNHDLMVLRNVVMNPFPTQGNFIGSIASEFKKVVAAEVEYCIQRNTLTPDNFTFLIQGTDPIYLVHSPKFHLGNHRQQFILAVSLPENTLSQLRNLRTANPSEPFILRTSRKINMLDILSATASGSNPIFLAHIESAASGTLIKNTTVTVQRTIKSRPLNSVNRDDNHPALPELGMPFYLYGDAQTPDLHIDHVLTRAPNIQLSADKVKLEMSGGSSGGGLDGAVKNGAIMTLDKLSEFAMQPFPPTSELSTPKTPSKTGVNGVNGSAGGAGPAHTGFFFRPGASFEVSVWKDAKDAQAVGPGLLDVCLDEKNKIGSGRVTLEGRVFVDSDGVNVDPFGRKDNMPDWIEEFNSIGKELGG